MILVVASLVVLMVVGVIGAVVVFGLFAASVPPVYGDCTAVLSEDTFYYSDVTQSDCQDFCTRTAANTGQTLLDCRWERR